MTQDYSRTKLRGKSFEGQNLSGADFSFCDLRGTNFSGAILRGANFSNARCGMQRRWLLSLLICSVILSLLSGLICTVGGSLLGFILVDNNPENLYVGIVCLIVLSLFFLICVSRGIAIASGFVGVAVIWAVLAAVLWTGIVAVAGTGNGISTETVAVARLVSIIVTGTVAVVVAAIGAVVASTTAALAGAIVGMFAIGVMVALSGAIAGVVAVAAATVYIKAGIVAAVVGVCVIVLSAYIACSAIYPYGVGQTDSEKDNSGKIKQSFIRNLIIKIAAKYSTNFEKADLTNADFTRAVVKNINLNKAIIIRTNWFQVRKLHLAAFAGTYLENHSLRHLLTTKDLQNKNFDGWNLQGLNLQHANLKDASFIATNLNDTNLRNADLSRARLVQALVDKTDFRSADLTGAYIEDWHITPTTRLEAAKCDYIFLRIPTPENPNPQRLPANWDAIFKPGEFAEFMSPLSRMR
ncbi:MAG: pentapeptide repeat-containing protein [Cyanobacteria bacterium P01_A01_bin.84]